MKHYDAELISSIDYKEFVPFLNEHYKGSVKVPQRPHFTLSENGSSETLLLMPAWDESQYIGVKMVTVFPENSQKDIDTIQGIYVLMDRKSGIILATFDGPSLTTKRTAAVSALASSLLSRKNASVLTLLGTGKLCTELIKAHCSVRRLEYIYIWGRRPAMARERVKQLIDEGIDAISVVQNEQAIKKSDIVSSATFSKLPLVRGEWLKTGCHVDLVGSFTPESREADDDCILGNSVFVDNYSALEESGDMTIPISCGILKKSDIKADLQELCLSPYLRKEDEITVFKSVGSAKSDLALAVYIYGMHTNFILT